jgi:Uma2 family endonuclease
MTADELWALPGNGCRRELLDGELVEMPPAGAEHGYVEGNVYYQLQTYVQPLELGRVLVGEPGVILRRGPDRVRAPDVCFIARERIPAEGLPKTFLEFVPDLIVEVVSPGDTAAEVQQKIEEWLQAGARLVWAVYPNTRSVVAYRGLDDIRVYAEGDTLNGVPVLPGFTCPVASLFK